MAFPPGEFDTPGGGPIVPPFSFSRFKKNLIQDTDSAITSIDRLIQKIKKCCDRFKHQRSSFLGMTWLPAKKYNSLRNNVLNMGSLSRACSCMASIAMQMNLCGCNVAVRIRCISRTAYICSTAMHGDRSCRLDRRKESKVPLSRANIPSAYFSWWNPRIYNLWLRAAGI